MHTRRTSAGGWREVKWRSWLRADPERIPEASGYHVPPSRPRWLTTLLFAGVVVVAAGVAHLFRHAANRVIEWYSDERDVVSASSSLHWLVVFGIVSASVFVAAWLGRLVDARHASSTGIEAVAASARGERRWISLRASLVRATGTWIASTGLTSIGRESAIIEIGGAVGAVAGRRSGGRGDALATAGIAAAFAAAYHAPFAALFYLGEHLGVHRSRRALWFAATGAAAGHLLSVHLMSGHVIFPTPEGSRWETLGLALLVVIPAVTGARALRVLRVRVKAGDIAGRLGAPWWTVVAVFALVAGAAVATFPFAAGNGMEALRQAAVGPTVAIAVALSLGKLIGTTASLGSGAPGGAISPSLSVAAGTALLTVYGLDALGIEPDAAVIWGALVAAMAVGVAVGLRSPVLAVVLVPELVGDYTFLPLIAVVVIAARLIDLGVDRLMSRLATPVPDIIYGDDA